MEYISAVDLSRKLQNQEEIIILDVREPYEHVICKIEAIHIPMNEVIQRVAELPQNKSIVVLCRTGKRAEAVANLLETEMKLSNISVLEGGIMEWIDKIDNQLEAY